MGIDNNLEKSVTNPNNKYATGAKKNGLSHCDNPFFLKKIIIS